MFGFSVEDINREVMMAMGGFEVGPVKLEHELEQTIIVLQVPLAMRANLGNLLVLPVRLSNGALVPLGELGRFVKRPVSPVIYHKDLRPLEYVVGDVIGRLGAPLYGMIDVDERLKKYKTPDGQVLQGSYFGRPADTNVSGFKWDGEWEVTYVTFRDMGIAFMAALVLIYILVVAEFRNFILPLVVMAPIPLTLIGIVPGHWLLNADFTATSMIGFIALAGIIVRNSILLVDFAKSRVEEGMSVQQAVVLAAEVRMRPIMITALALVIGSVVLLTDPIFQGMAVSLLFGSLVATFLTLVVIPLGCLSARSQFCVAPSCNVPPRGGPAPGMPPGGMPPSGPPPSEGGPPAGRPTRLVKRTEAGEGGIAAAAAAAAAAVGAEPQEPGRPARLVKRSEAAEAAPATEPAVPGRPPKLVKKAEAAPPPPEAAGGRPPRLVRKSDLPAGEAAETPAAAPPGRPAPLLKKPAVEPAAQPAAAPQPLPPEVAAEPEPPEPAPFIEPPLPESVATAEAPHAPIASTAEEVAESLAPKSSARLSRMKKPGDKPASGGSANGREGRAGPGPAQAGAEGRERKYVAKPKAAAESRESVRGEPAAKTEKAADKASQDKIAAVQSGKKKLRGIRINPDLE
jgi:hypothetical protein